MARRRPLEGKAVVVVGGLNRSRRLYREVIESLGGEMVAFIPGDETRSTGLSGADLVVLITRGQAHKVTQKVVSVVGKDKLVYVNSLGKNAVREALLRAVEGGRAHAAYRESG